MLDKFPGTYIHKCLLGQLGRHKHDGALHVGRRLGVGQGVGGRLCDAPAAIEGALALGGERALRGGAIARPGQVRAVVRDDHVVARWALGQLSRKT